MRFITGDSLPEPGGHYSHAVVANGLVWVSGQLPIAGPDRRIPEGIAAQTDTVLDNLEAVLAAAGCSLAALVSVSVHVADIALWPAVNDIYARRLGGHRPARTVTVSPQLHYGCLIEVSAVATAVEQASAPTSSARKRS